MIKVTTYKCEVCGKEFANEDECLTHELRCKTAGLENSVVMMDCSKEILIPDNWDEAIDRAYFIYIANQEAADKLKTLFRDYNYTFPADDIDEEVCYPALFIYQESEIRWKSLQEIENEYNELLSIKNEMEYLSR